MATLESRRIRQDCHGVIVSANQNPKDMDLCAIAKWAIGANLGGHGAAKSDFEWNRAKSVEIISGDVNGRAGGVDGAEQ
jgi:hypothetical protein